MNRFPAEKREKSASRLAQPLRRADIHGTLRPLAGSVSIDPSPALRDRFAAAPFPAARRFHHMVRDPDRAGLR